MDIVDCLDPGCVCFLSGSTKQEAVAALVALLCRVCSELDAAQVQEAVAAREGLMSTGIGLGIGVPHVRLEGVAKLVMAVGIHPTGITDYESLDGKPVRIVVLIVGGKQQHQDYVRLLANLVALLKEEQFRAALLGQDTPEGVHKLLVGPPAGN